MKKSLLLAALISFAAFVTSGCTTSGTNSAQMSPAFTEIPDLAAAPVPTMKPEEVHGFAVASLAASELPPEAVTVAYAGPVVDHSIVAPSPLDPAIPDEAVSVASAPAVNADPFTGTPRDRECLMRAMYFESNRSSRDGQLAVGTVVMHRLTAGNWGKTVCAVVGAPKQFAPGVMTRKMQGDTTDLAALADAILAGKRHPTLGKNVMYFHQAGLKFPYRNMKYVLVAGGNTFYYKAGRRRG